MHAKSVFLGTLVATLVVATGASAAPKKTEPALPAPALKLTLAPAPAGPWRIQIENRGEVPVRLAADARLITLEITAPADGKKKPVVAKCTLPDDARPASDDGSELVIPPTRSWSASFDPLFYCFGAKERGALVAGATVRARFGWTTGGATKGPYAAVATGAGVGKVANAKALDADPITLSDSVTLGANATDDTGENPVTLTVPDALDVSRGVELGTTVTLVNGSDRAITLLYRPEMLLFRVVGPGGGVACGFPHQVPAPIRELYTTVGSHGKTSVGVLFTTTCPAGTFDEPGIYRLTPKLDVTGASARSIGLRTWDGTATAKKPLLLRVRNARRFALPPKPTLD